MRSAGDNAIVIAWMAKRTWEVEFHPDCETWANDLSQPDKEALLAAIRILRGEGPTLGRPLVDTIVGSRHPNMKELRPGSTGRSEIRVLFAFDAERQAILLIGGDKSEDWKGWYERNIPIADESFDEHQKRLRERHASTKRTKTKKSGQTKGKRKR